MSHPVVEERPHEMSGSAYSSVGVTGNDGARPPGQEPIVARDCAGQKPGMCGQEATSPFIKGVVNLRGLVVPVFDLKVRFNPPEAHAESLNLQMVTDDAGRVVGAVPNEAGAVIELQGVAIAALPGFETDHGSGPITGIGLVERADKPGTLILAYIRQRASGGNSTAAG
jgi:CheW-like domain